MHVTRTRAIVMNSSREALRYALVCLVVLGCDENSQRPTTGAKHDATVEPVTSVAPVTSDAAAVLDGDGSITSDSTISRPDASDIADANEVAATDADDVPTSLCDKYGGSVAVARVVSDHVVPALTQDCRINAYFAALSEAGVQRLGECLSIQVQELFGCAGVAYAGSHASNGLPCRSMAKAHIGLQISQGDFEALIEDVVSALTAAGVAAGDISLVAPALLGTQDDIVEQPTTKPGLNACE